MTQIGLLLLGLGEIALYPLAAVALTAACYALTRRSGWWTR